MHNIKIVFQAYIPKNLGKSLLSYFPNYKLNLLQNKSEFIGKIKEFDRGYQTWLPEPGSSVSSNFFATDDANYHGSNHRSHTSRLRIEMNIDIGKVGNYKLPSEIFRHRYHKNWLGNEFQHSSLSQRVKAYIKRIPFYTDFPGRPSPKDIYFGVCHKEMNLRAQELPIKAYVNSHTNNSITTIDVDKVSANYPYLKRLAPNIDFKLKTKIKINQDVIKERILSQKVCKTQFFIFDLFTTKNLDLCVLHRHNLRILLKEF